VAQLDDAHVHLRDSHHGSRYGAHVPVNGDGDAPPGWCHPHPTTRIFGGDVAVYIENVAR